MSSTTLNLRKFFITTNGFAIAIAFVAALVNACVGPFNIVMWVMPIAMLVFAGLVLILFQDAVLQAANPNFLPWTLRRIFGRRVVYFLRRLHVWNTRIVSSVFLCFVPSFFLLLAVLLLVGAIRGDINRGN